MAESRSLLLTADEGHADDGEENSNTEDNETIHTKSPLGYRYLKPIKNTMPSSCITPPRDGMSSEVRLCTCESQVFFIRPCSNLRTTKTVAITQARSLT